MTRLRWRLVVRTKLWLAAIVLVCTEAHAWIESYTTFEIPSSTQVFPTAINSEGVIAGYYTPAGPPLPPRSIGFVRDSLGTITPFEAPGALRTMPSAINNYGYFAGWYFDRFNDAFGFVRDPQGNITIN